MSIFIFHLKIFETKIQINFLFQFKITAISTTLPKTKQKTKKGEWEAYNRSRVTLHLVRQTLPVL
jgi:hypothetical protein